MSRRVMLVLEHRLPHHVHRPEQPEHPFVQEAKQWAKEAGSVDNRLINWAVRLQEERLVFENRPRT